MLQTLKDYFLERVGPDRGNGGSGNDQELAAAVLMVEISLADSTQQEVERKVMLGSLQTMFRLSADDAQKVLELAEHEVDHAVSLYEFTRHLNQTMSAAERAGIIECLWRVAFADSVLDKYEEYYVRKVADLLYVPHRDFIQAKLRAGGGASGSSE